MKGEKYNSWTVISEVFRLQNKDGKTIKYVTCRCDCGTVTDVGYINLVSGKSKRCNVSGRHKRKDTRENHRLYSTWKSMLTRCNNSNCSSYKFYGHRGIKVCGEWHDFEKFVKDMYSSFEEGLTLDRVDNNGNYCKENCRWATPLEQATNKRKNLKLEFQGKVYTEAQLSREFGVKRTTLQARRNKGYTVEEMIYGKDKPRNIQKTKSHRSRKLLQPSQKEERAAL